MRNSEPCFLVFTYNYIGLHFDILCNNTFSFNELKANILVVKDNPLTTTTLPLFVLAHRCFVAQQKPLHTIVNQKFSIRANLNCKAKSKTWLSALLFSLVELEFADNSTGSLINNSIAEQWSKLNRLTFILILLFHYETLV